MVAIDVVAEISPLGSPEEYADFEPPTGPMSLVSQATDEDASSTGAAVDALPAAVHGAGAPEVPEAIDAAVDEPEAHEGSSATDVPGGATVVPFPVVGDDAAATASDETSVAEGTLVVDAADASSEGDASDVATDEAHIDEDADVPETPFQRRDAALVPLIVAGARKLKRVLADEQNEVLDALRRREPVRSLDALVPAATDQSERYVDTIAPGSMLAAEAGSVSVEGTVALDLGATGTLAPVREALATGLVVPFRERLERCVDEGDGDNDTVTKRARAVYREWKTQRIDEQLDDVFRLAYGRGQCDAIEPGTAVSWIVDPDGPACPDAEDNALAGVVELGQGFPTGHTCAPAHAGCRCLIAPVDR